MAEKENTELKPNFLPTHDIDDFGEKEKAQSVNHRVFTRAPGAREVGEGEIVFSKIGAVYRQYTKIKGVVRSVVMT